LNPSFLQVRRYKPRIPARILQWRLLRVVIIADDERDLLLGNGLIGRHADECNCK
jgi:hypothetical protein